MFFAFTLPAFSTLQRYLKGLFAIRVIKNWQVALRHVVWPTSFSAEMVDYQLSNGLKFVTLPSKRNRTILLSIYEIMIKEIYPIKTPGLEVIVDLGAQIGVFSVYAANQRSSKIYAFEPEPENFKTLEQNIALNEFQDRIIPKQICVAATSGTTDFYIDESSSRSGGRYKSLKQSTTAITVETSTLDEIIAGIPEGDVDLIKVDIEGSEYDVFYSASPSALRRIKRVYMECHEVNHTSSAYTLEQMMVFLKEAGFNVVVRHDEPIIYAERSD